MKRILTVGFLLCLLILSASSSTVLLHNQNAVFSQDLCELFARLLENVNYRRAERARN